MREGMGSALTWLFIGTPWLQVGTGLWDRVAAERPDMCRFLNQGLARGECGNAGVPAAELGEAGGRGPDKEREGRTALQWESASWTSGALPTPSSLVSTVPKCVVVSFCPHPPTPSRPVQGPVRGPWNRVGQRALPGGGRQVRAGGARGTALSVLPGFP